MSPNAIKLLEQCQAMRRWSQELHRRARESLEQSRRILDEFQEAQADAGQLRLLVQRTSRRLRARGKA